jgi:hypothetical protein
LVREQLIEINLDLDVFVFTVTFIVPPVAIVQEEDNGELFLYAIREYNKLDAANTTCETLEARKRSMKIVSASLQIVRLFIYQRR